MRAFDKTDFAPVAPRLSDTIPPVDNPPEPVPTKRPRQHTVCAWRIDGNLHYANFPTLESAQEYARGLAFAVFYKWCILCGRELVERATIAAPVDWEQNLEAFQRWCAANGY